MTLKQGVCSVVTILSVSTLTACGQGVSFNAQQASQSTPSTSLGQVDAVPACEINIPQLELVANVNSFEFQNSGGVTFGYNSNGADAGLGGSASIKVSKASMDLTMEGLNPMNGAIQLSEDVTSSQTSTTLNATIDFSQFSVTPNYYTSTPLATVSSSGLVKAVQAVKSAYDSTAWIGRVLNVESDGSVLLNAGASSGLMIGDTFYIYNVTHIWQNNLAPCAAGNQYYGSERTPVTPVAVATVTQLPAGSNVAIATVTFMGTTNLKLGSEVAVDKLVTATSGTRYLKKTVTVGTVAAKSFSLPGGGTFDFGSAVSGQILGAVINNGFVVSN